MTSGEVLGCPALSTTRAGPLPWPRASGPVPSGPTSSPRCPRSTSRAARPTRRRGCAHRRTWTGSPPSPARPAPAAAPSRSGRVRMPARRVRATGVARSTRSSTGSPAPGQGQGPPAVTWRGPSGGTGGEVTAPGAGTRPASYPRSHPAAKRVLGTVPSSTEDSMVAPTCRAIRQGSASAWSSSPTPSPARRYPGGRVKPRSRSGTERRLWPAAAASMVPGRCGPRSGLFTAPVRLRRTGVAAQRGRWRVSCWRVVCQVRRSRQCARSRKTATWWSGFAPR